MKNGKRFIIPTLLCIVTLLLSLLVMTGFTTAKVANAETNNISVQ